MAAGVGHDLRTDPRSRRTLSALQRALLETVRTRPVSQVSVAELCRTAGVHRTTFYKHFATVPELARHALRDLLAPVAVPDPPAYGSWLVGLLEHVAAHRGTFAGLVGPDGDPTLARTLSDQLVVRAEQALRARPGSAATTDLLPRARVLGFATYGALEAVLLGASPAACAEIVLCAPASDASDGG